jgi:hypothetical protein
MIEAELEEVSQGKLHLSIVNLQDSMVGFIVCNQVKAPH